MSSQKKRDVLALYLYKTVYYLSLYLSLGIFNTFGFYQSSSNPSLFFSLKSWLENESKRKFSKSKN